MPAALATVRQPPVKASHSITDSHKLAHGLSWPAQEAGDLDLRIERAAAEALGTLLAGSAQLRAAAELAGAGPMLVRVTTQGRTLFGAQTHASHVARSWPSPGVLLAVLFPRVMLLAMEHGDVQIELGRGLRKSCCSFDDDAVHTDW